MSSVFSNFLNFFSSFFAEHFQPTRYCLNKHKSGITETDPRPRLIIILKYLIIHVTFS